jgi:chromosome segregation ATPase
MSTTEPPGVEKPDAEIIQRAQAAIEELSRRGATASRELVAVYERERRLLGGIRKRDAELVKLRARCAALERKVANVTERYENLSGAALPRLQRSYWRLRKRLSGGKKGNAK